VGNIKVPRPKLKIIFAIYSLTCLESCSTQESTEGTCIPFHDCKVLHSLLPKARASARMREYLMRTQCRVTSRPPYVCCPSDNSAIRTGDESVQQIPRIKLPKASDGVCGRSFDPNAHLPNRIVGGESAHLGEFPWAALLGYLRRESNDN
jgi:hypothetical protein